MAEVSIGYYLDWDEITVERILKCAGSKKYRRYKLPKAARAKPPENKITGCRHFDVWWRFLCLVIIGAVSGENIQFPIIQIEYNPHTCT